jgi:hypothetical protein
MGRHTMNAGAFAAVAGIAVPSGGLLVLPIWRFPGTDSSGADIVRFISDNRASLQTVMTLNTVGVTLWLVFGAALWARLRSTARRDLSLIAIFGAGLIGFITLLLAGFTVFDVLVYRTPGPAGARVVYDLTFGLLAMSGMPTAVALGAYAFLIKRQRLLPAWTGHFAAVVAVAHLALLLSMIVPRGVFSLEGQVITVVPGLLWAWILGTGVAQLRRGACVLDYRDYASESS